MTNLTRLLRLVCLPVLLLLGAPAYAMSNFIGINTNEATHFDSSAPFVDLFRTAEPFRESPLSKGSVAYDQNGWVSSLNGGQAGSYFARWLPFDTLPRGSYVVRYDGKGKLAYQESAQLVSSTPGRDVIRLVPDRNNEISAALIIQQTDPNDPVRNIRITLPGGICQGNPFERVEGAKDCGGQYLSFEEHSQEIVFNPDFLQFMRAFRTIRFMGMSGITRNPEQSWAQRPNMQEATWGGQYGSRGVPLEIMVMLANTLNANAWFNLPHQADNDYVRQYAQYVKDNLRPNLKAYVEYTNEVWNSVFSQAQYVQQMGLREKLDDKTLYAGLKFYAKRSREIFQIWEQVFGGTGRLVRVLSGWANNPAVSPMILKYADVYKFTDVFAIAPYFYADQQRLMQASSVDDIFSLIDSDPHYSIDKVLEALDKQAELIKPYGVKLVAYEGGQHLVHYGTRSLKQPPNPLLMQANRDPKMEQAYIRLLDGFRKAGGTLFMAFSAPRINGHFGFWGIKEHINQPSGQAPKYRALMRF